MAAESQSEKIICPKCGFVQGPSEECSRCGVIFRKYQESIKRKENVELGCGCLTIIIAIIVVVIFLFKCCGSNEKINDQSEKEESGKRHEAVKHCESEVDKQICNDVLKARALYYKISHEKAPGSYVRDKAMGDLVLTVRAHEEEMIDKYGLIDSIFIYRQFVGFIKFREMAAKTKSDNKVIYDISNRNLKNIENFCESCVDGFK